MAWKILLPIVVASFLVAVTGTWQIFKSVPSLRPFAPAALLLFGALLAAGATFWSASRTISSSSEISAKNDEIIRLTNELREQETGGKDCYLIVSFNSPAYLANNGAYRLMAFNDGKYACLDTVAKIRKIERPSASEPLTVESVKKEIHRDEYKIGNVPARGVDTDIWLRPGAYQIDIFTRSGYLVEFLTFENFKDELGVKVVLSNGSGNDVVKVHAPSDYVPTIP